MTKDAPCLESLTVDVEGASLETSFPLDLFNGRTPQLRHVSIERIRPAWSLSLLRNLHTLMISTVRCQEPISKVLDVLEQMPVLQRLELWHSLPDYTAQPISVDSNQRCVALRSLSQLIITDSANEVAYLMSHLDLPEGVISHFALLRCFYFKKEFQDSFIAFAIKAYETLNVNPRPRGLELVIRPDTIKFKVTFGRPDIVYTFSNDRPFTFEFDYEPPYRNERLWLAMINIISLLDLRFLNIVCEVPVDFSWASLFESLKNLKSVEIAFHSTMKSFIAAYNAAGALEEAGPHRYDPDAIPLSSLHSLSLKFIKFHDDSLLLDELIDLLTMRDKRGYRLPLLKFSKLWSWKDDELSLFEVWVAKLSPLVEELEH